MSWVSAIEVRVDEAQLRAAEEALAGIKDGLGIAVSRALNKTTLGARAEIVRIIRARLPIPARAIRSAWRVAKADRTRLVAGLRARHGKTSLHLLNARQTASGVQHTPMEGMPGNIPHAFISRGETGEIFIRAPGDSPSGLARRYPLRNLKAPSIVEVFESAEELAGSVYQQRVQGRLGIEIERQVNVLIAQQGRK